MKQLDWTEKYRPQTLSEIVGHNKALEELRNWAQAWMHGVPEARAVVLYGRAGIGKTTAAHALAHEMGWEVVEMNASDQRTADIIEKVVGSGSQMGTFSGTRRLVIMDEADNIHGTADRGGEKAILELIKKTNQPIILIANELYDMSAGLRAACKPVEFRAVMARSMIPALRRIVEAEGIKCEIGVLEKIAENANGDLRSAINDLQAIGQGKAMLLLSDIITGERDSKESIFKVLVKIFKGGNIIEAHSATFNLDENPEDFIQWVDENLHLEFRKYLFNWDNIPGNESKNLLNFLVSDLHITGLENDKIIKTNDGRTICVLSEETRVEILLDVDTEEVILKISDGRTYNPPVKKEKGKSKKDTFKIYYPNTKDLQEGYRYLSRASLFLARVSRRQNYNMWRYASVLMTSGIVVARSNRSSEYVNYQPPSLWRKLGQTRGLRQVRDSACGKIGLHCHVSTGFVRSQMLSFFRMMLKDEEYAPYVAALLDLEPEEIAFLLESKATKNARKIYEEAQALREAEVEHEVELFGGFGRRKEAEVEVEKPEKEEPQVKKEERKEVKSQSSLFDF